MLRRSILFAAVLLMSASCTPTVQTAPPAPEVEPAKTAVHLPSSSAKARVLILGDSQISFGAGAPYTAFFRSIGSACDGVPDRFRTTSASAIGVRSTALHHWTSTSDRGPICDIDQRFGVNAGAYGVTSKDRSYVQIGQDPAYPLCPAARTSLTAALDTYAPDLIVLSFLGNAVDRWSSAATARADWAAIAAELPDDVACIAMTTIPSYDRTINAKRSAAQTNLEAAVTGNGRCAFVPGYTPRTVATFEGNASHFRTNSDGVVTDPGHPSEASAGRFVTLQTPALCAAAASVLTD